jgi:hypothetical protein
MIAPVMEKPPPNTNTFPVKAKTKKKAQQTQKSRKEGINLPVTRNVGDEDGESLNFTAQIQQKTQRTLNFRKITEWELLIFTEMGKSENEHSFPIFINKCLSNHLRSVNKHTPSSETLA